MFQKIRKSRITKVMVVYLSLTMIFDFFNPFKIFALTGGPGQMEFQSFRQADINQMVDLFTGDFNYNIPLLDVEGYPINLFYDANITMEQEASWVGLGWNINPGSVNRQVRGLPDDFNGDLISQKFKLKPNTTSGSNNGGGFRLNGSFSINLGKVVDLTLGQSGGIELLLGSYMNSYRGRGYQLKTNMYTGKSADISVFGFGAGASGGLGLNTTLDSQNGININPSYSYSGRLFCPAYGTTSSYSKLFPYNTRRGLKEIIESKGRGHNYFTFSSSYNGSSAISLGTPTYTPQIPYNYMGSSSSFRMLNGFWSDFFYGYSANETYSSEQYPINNNVSRPCYGYLYTENGSGNPFSILDFNREKDGLFTSETPNLPVTNFTFDLYSVTGQGVSAMYRPHRNDIGTLNNPVNLGTASGSNTLREKGYGLFYHSVKGDGTSTLLNTSGPWAFPNNKALYYLNFGRSLYYTIFAGTNDPLYEPCYFKNAGEKTIFNKSFYDGFGGENPTKVLLTNSNTSVKYGTLNYFSTKKDRNSFTISPIPTANTQQARQARNNLFTFLRADLAGNHGLVDSIENYTPYPPSSNGTKIKNDINRVDATVHKKHHISEVTVLKSDGARYIYGIPAYNTKQNQVSFSVSENAAKDCLKGTVVYNHTGSNPDNSLYNIKGRENYFNSSELPPYAHSNLLTAVLSPDYVDLTSDGPTEDDLGNYTKINYSRIYDAGNSYKWRIPFSKENPDDQDYPKAQYVELFKSDVEDDRAQYTYGEKEIWYVHSIESKNYIAEFYLTDRVDGFGVKGENGWIDTSKPLKKLSKIVLYTKEDRIKNGSNATPLKTVHFEYDYSLCPNVPNNSEVPVYDEEMNNLNAAWGKLTLRKIYFTYGNSKKGMLTPYEFNYSSTNPDYGDNDGDRWGNYKPNNCSLTNTDFPYTEQDDRATADLYASAWKLTDIKLPNGSAINIVYESDDYAYVQDQRAMQMFKITGTGPISNFPPTSYNGLSIFNNYLFFELQKDENGNPMQNMFEDYFKGINYLYFKCKVDLTGNGDWEYVPGYAKIAGYNVSPANSNYGWVKLQSVNISDNYQLPVNPITKAAWQYARLNIPRKIWKDCDYPNNPAACLWQSLRMDAQTLKKGGNLNRVLFREGFGAVLDQNDSWIRLLNPTMKKVGGNSRVKQITVSDNWGSMGGTTDFTYGQTYEYTMTLPSGREISSGVAAYEPMEGNDENPFRQSEAFTVENRLAPDDHHYQETPFGESFFPAPVIGYRQVKVKNIEHINVTRNATGYSLHKFYTAYDFPTKPDKTPLSTLDKLDINESKIGLGVHYVGASQGFAIEINDMHGKPKAVEIYSEGDLLNPVNSIEYFYKTDSKDTKKLDNHAVVIHKDGSKSDEVIGMDMDIVADTRSSLKFNNESMYTKTYELVPGISLITGGRRDKSTSSSTDITAFNSIVLTKLINRYGLIDSVVVKNVNSRQTTKLLAYDAETGEVLLTRTENEFSDPVYDFVTPAHWAYQGMEPAYKNINAKFLNINTQPGGIVQIQGAEDIFVEGDYLRYIYDGSSQENYCWVIKVETDKITCIDQYGQLVYFTDDIHIQILRSGRKNMQNAPVSMITTLENPISGQSLAFDKVLNVSAMEYDEKCDIFCGQEEEGETCPFLGTTNPFLKGLKGNWRPLNTYSYNTKRLPNTTATASTVREDGIFETYTPFWGYNATLQKMAPVYTPEHPDYQSQNPYQDWINNSTATIYSPYGYNLENKDVLDRYSAVLYGYSPFLHNLPIATAVNARYNQIAYEGFEDGDYRDDMADACALRHCYLFQESAVATEHHTGKKSMHLGEGMHLPVTYDVNVPVGQPPSEPRVPFVVDQTDCIGYFAPSAGKYIVSAWVKVPGLLPTGSYPDISIDIDLTSNQYTFIPQGPVIDGWQRIEGVFEIDPNDDQMELKLNNGCAESAYIDDIRIHPFNAGMKTMVYDPVTLRLMAELDDYNYATFYEYDEEGMPIRVNKETTEGVKTVSEKRNGLFKN